MGRSLGFGSTEYNLDALLGLAFATAPEEYSLTLLYPVTRRPIMQKVRRHSDVTSELQLLVGTWFQVLFHSPHRGSFHLSLTVLVLYRSESNI
jgi:hypothetical protein